jgi:hypothetical protein
VRDPSPRHPTLCLRAALHYSSSEVSYGWKVFPADVARKKSYLSKAHSPEGLNWGMSDDPAQLTKNFSNPSWRDKCGVGLPTGAINRIFVVEADTPEGHEVDGIASLRLLNKAYGKFPPTLQAKSPSGSMHYYFQHPGGDLKVISRSHLDGYQGVDVKGDGGMVIAPPSRRTDGGEYVWLNDHEIAAAPGWLLELVSETARDDEMLEALPDADENDPFAQYAREVLELPDLDEVMTAAEQASSEGMSWEEWCRMGMSIYSAFPNEDGFRAFDLFSSKAGNYNQNETTRQRWRKISGSPPTRGLTIRTFMAFARSDEDTTEDTPRTNGSINGHDHDLSASPDDPVDLWQQYLAPELPQGLLPALIEEYAFEQAHLMGADPAGLAMGALTVCAAMIPDSITLQVKRHDPHWKEPARLWTALVGGVSARKSPIVREVSRPLVRMNNELVKRYGTAMRAYEALPKDQRDISVEPVPERLKIEDSTPEAVQGILQDNPQGVLLIRDELAGWFGSMEKYGNNRNGAADRSFWLQAYNGGGYSFDRVKRGSHHIENLGISVLGGIQPSAIQQQADAIVDDGLIQRLNPVMLRNASLSNDDRPVSAVARGYDHLVERLYQYRMNFNGDLTFNDDAQTVRQLVSSTNDKLLAVESFNQKLAGHFGKYDGMFARLCVLWHCVERVDNYSTVVTADVAHRVREFMDRFLRGHAVAFYCGLLGLSDGHERLRAIAGYILSRQLGELTARDVQRGDSGMRNLARQHIENICEHLVAFGWLTRLQSHRSNSTKWLVNPAVHRIFAVRATAESARRKQIRALIQQISPVTLEGPEVHNKNKGLDS